MHGQVREHETKVHVHGGNRPAGGLAPAGHSWILRCNRAENDFLGPSESINQPHLLAVEGRQQSLRKDPGIIRDDAHPG